MKSSNLYVKQFEVGPMQNNVYLVGDKDKKECVLIDPAWDVHTVLSQAKRDGMKITAVILTHTHFDHVNGLEDLLRHIDVEVVIHRSEVSHIQGLAARLRKVEDGDSIRLGTLTVKFLHTPGHTPGSLCVLVGGNLFTGDTLFIGGCGRTDLAGGSVEEMYKSLTRLAQLPDETVIFPGHNYGDRSFSTLGDEKRTNPFLQCHSLKSFVDFQSQ